MSLLKTPLYSEHIRLKAKMLEFAGYEMPISYDSYSGGMRQEHLLVREKLGIFDVSHMGEFWIEGPQAREFLSYATTKDFESSKDFRAYYSLLLESHGGMADDIIVYRLAEDRYWMVVNAANCLKDWQLLEKLSKNFDVHLKNESDETALIAVQGPLAEEYLSKLVPGVKELAYYGFCQHDSWIIGRTGYTGEDGFEVFLPHSDAMDLWRKLLEMGAMPIGLGARDTLRLEVGFPLYGHELTSEIRPEESLSAFAVRNPKDFHGKASSPQSPRWKPIALLGNNPKPMRAGEKIFLEGRQVGELTSGSTSPILRQGMGLGLIHSSCPLEQQMTFMLESGGKQREAILTSLPFVETRRVKKKQG